MSYNIRETENGETLVVSMEVPMYEGINQELGRQAQVFLTSALRHMAVCDWIDAYLDTSDPDIRELMNQEHAQVASQLVNTLMSIAGLADNLNIDINRELWEMPWEV